MAGVATQCNPTSPFVSPPPSPLPPPRSHGSLFDVVDALIRNPIPLLAPTLVVGAYLVLFAVHHSADHRFHRRKSAQQLHKEARLAAKARRRKLHERSGASSGRRAASATTVPARNKSLAPGSPPLLAESLPSRLAAAGATSLTALSLSPRGGGGADSGGSGGHAHSWTSASPSSGSETTGADTVSDLGVDASARLFGVAAPPPPSTPPPPLPPCSVSPGSSSSCSTPPSSPSPPAPSPRLLPAAIAAAHRSLPPSWARWRSAGALALPPPPPPDARELIAAATRRNLSVAAIPPSSHALDDAAPAYTCVDTLPQAAGVFAGGSGGGAASAASSPGPAAPASSGSNWTEEEDLEIPAPALDIPSPTGANADVVIGFGTTSAAAALQSEPPAAVTADASACGAAKISDAAVAECPTPVGVSEGAPPTIVAADISEDPVQPSSALSVPELSNAHPLPPPPPPPSHQSPRRGPLTAPPSPTYAPSPPPPNTPLSPLSPFTGLPAPRLGVPFAMELAKRRRSAPAHGGRYVPGEPRGAGASYFLDDAEAGRPGAVSEEIAIPPRASGTSDGAESPATSILPTAVTGGSRPAGEATATAQAASSPVCPQTPTPLMLGATSDSPTTTALHVAPTPDPDSTHVRPTAVAASRERPGTAPSPLWRLGGPRVRRAVDTTVARFSDYLAALPGHRSATPKSHLPEPSHSIPSPPAPTPAPVQASSGSGTCDVSAAAATDAAANATADAQAVEEGHSEPGPLADAPSRPAKPSSATLSFSSTTTTSSSATLHAARQRGAASATLSRLGQHAHQFMLRGNSLSGLNPYQQPLPRRFQRRLAQLHARARLRLQEGAHAPPLAPLLTHHTSLPPKPQPLSSSPRMVHLADVVAAALAAAATARASSARALPSSPVPTAPTAVTAPATTSTSIAPSPAAAAPEPTAGPRVPSSPAVPDHVATATPPSPPTPVSPSTIISGPSSTGRALSPPVSRLHAAAHAALALAEFDVAAPRDTICSSAAGTAVVAAPCSECAAGNASAAASSAGAVGRSLSATSDRLHRAPPVQREWADNSEFDGKAVMSPFPGGSPRRALPPDAAAGGSRPTTSSTATSRGGSSTDGTALDEDRREVGSLGEDEGSDALSEPTSLSTHTSGDVSDDSSEGASERRRRNARSAFERSTLVSPRHSLFGHLLAAHSATIARRAASNAAAPGLGPSASTRPRSSAFAEGTGFLGQLVSSVVAVAKSVRARSAGTPSITSPTAMLIDNVTTRSALVSTPLAGPAAAPSIDPVCVSPLVPPAIAAAASPMSNSLSPPSLLLPGSTAATPQPDGSAHLMLAPTLAAPPPPPPPPLPSAALDADNLHPLCFAPPPSSPPPPPPATGTNDLVQAAPRLRNRPRSLRVGIPSLHVAPSAEAPVNSPTAATTGLLAPAPFAVVGADESNDKASISGNGAANNAGACAGSNDDGSARGGSSSRSTSCGGMPASPRDQGEVDVPGAVPEAFVSHHLTPTRTTPKDSVLAPPTSSPSVVNTDATPASVEGGLPTTLCISSSSDSLPPDPVTDASGPSPPAPASAPATTDSGSNATTTAAADTPTNPGGANCPARPASLTLPPPGAPLPPDAQPLAMLLGALVRQRRAARARAESEARARRGWRGAIRRACDSARHLGSAVWLGLQHHELPRLFSNVPLDAYSRPRRLTTFTAMLLGHMLLAAALLAQDCADEAWLWNDTNVDLCRPWQPAGSVFMGALVALIGWLAPPAYRLPFHSACRGSVEEGGGGGVVSKGE